MSVSLNLDAPIIPGKSAARIQVSQPIDDLLNLEWLQDSINDAFGSFSSTCFRPEAVDLWVPESGLIDQIGVHGPYRGKLFDSIALGMTIDDIERLIGPCAEDDEDNLSIHGVRGLVFDVEWRPDHFIPEDMDFQWPELRFSPLTYFFVFEEQTYDPWHFWKNGGSVRIG